MKDSEPAMSVADEAEKFHANFTSRQEELAKKIACSESIAQEDQKIHFSELNSSLECLQKYYSASSPYLRIYYRKRYQDALQELQGKIIELEERILPRKKFGFKGVKAKRPTVVKNGSTAEVPDMILSAGPPDGCLVTEKVDEVIQISSSTGTGKAILLSKLRGCTVRVLAAPSTVHIADVKDCTISIGPVTTSVFVESAHACQFQLACQQLRVHETRSTDFYIHVTSKAIIEDCTNVRFGVYSFSYPALEEDYLVTGLNKSVNNWKDVDDFNWLVAGQTSPNWSLIDESS